jgi:hypothetical protein
MTISPEPAGEVNSRGSGRPLAFVVMLGTSNMAHGVSWFVGSAAGGWLYTRTPGWLAAFSLALQLAAVPVLLAAARARRLE